MIVWCSYLFLVGLLVAGCYACYVVETDYRSAVRRLSR